MNISATLDQSFAGKTIWIGGGAGYLGTQVVGALVESGARVVVWDLPGKDTGWEYAKHPMVQFRVGNLGEGKAVPEWFADLPEGFAEPDGAVLMTYRTIGKTLEDLSFDEMSEALVIGCAGPFIWCREVAQRMAERGKGSLVVFSSMYGSLSPYPDNYRDGMLINPVEYGMQKSALNQLIRYFAVHYGKSGVRTNGISPGPFPSKETQAQHPEFVQRLCEKGPTEPRRPISRDDGARPLSPLGSRLVCERPQPLGRRRMVELVRQASFLRSLSD